MTEMIWIAIGIFAVAFIILLVALAINFTDTSNVREKPRDPTPITKRRGIQGEKAVNYHLRRLVGENEYLLTNVLLPLENGHKTEIDSILISKKEFFA